MWPAHSLQFRMSATCLSQTGAGSKPHSLEAGQAEARAFASKLRSPCTLLRGARRVPVPTTSFPFSEKPDGPQPAPSSEGQRQPHLPAYPSRLQPRHWTRVHMLFASQPLLSLGHLKEAPG